MRRMFKIFFQIIYDYHRGYIDFTKSLQGLRSILYWKSKNEEGV